MRHIEPNDSFGHEKMPMPAADYPDGIQPAERDVVRESACDHQVFALCSNHGSRAQRREEPHQLPFPSDVASPNLAFIRK